MSNPFKIKKEKYLYYIFAVISLAVTIIIYMLVKDQFLPLSIEIVESSDTGKQHYQSIYHDFEGNEINIKVFLFRKDDRNISTLSLQNEREAFSEFNFQIDHQLKNESLFFYDIDHDLRDDIFMFYQDKDSVFLDIIEYKDGFPRSTYFITSKPDSVENEIWDISIFPIGIRTKEKEYHLYFYICGWYSKYPRNIYDYNLSTKSIDNVFVTNASIDKSKFFDINKDGSDEIILTTYSSANISLDKKYNDQKSYLFILNLNLDLVFDPIVNNSIFVSTHVAPIINDQNNYLFLLQPKHGKQNQIRAEIIDKDGNIKLYKNYTANHLSDPIAYNLNNQNSVLYFVLDNRLLKVDQNLNEINSVEVNEKMSLLRTLNLNNEYKKILLAYMSHKPHSLYLYSPDLKILGEINLPSSLSFFNNQNLMTEKLSRDNDKRQFQFMGTEKNFLISIEENPHAKFIYLYFFLTFIVIFLFISGGHQVSKRISLYFQYFLHSLRDTPIGILVVNGAGNIIYKNFRLHQILNIDDSDNRKANYKNLLIHYKELIEIINSAIENNPKVAHEFTIRKGDETINGEIRVTPFISFYGLTYAYTIEIFDFSKMLLSDRMKSWSSTAQKIAHDIKTPLSTIQLNLKAIQRRMEKEAVTNQEIYNEDIGRIRNELERIKTLSKNFLKFANLDKPECKKVDIGELIKYSFSQFENYTKENVQVEFNFESSAKYVWADPNQLEQLFHILIENSIDSMKGEGTITISCCLVEQLHDVNVRWIEIEFSDNGAGISQENLSKVFEPYFTTKVDGTGFGLALAHKIVKDHNGKINIYSKENMGTTFRILLPAADNEIDN